MLEFIIITGLSIAGLLFCLTKWGVLSWYQVYRKKWMPEADCYFCISSWLAIIPMQARTFLKVENYDFGDRWAMPLLAFCFALVAVKLAIGALSAFICSVIIQPETR